MNKKKIIFIIATAFIIASCGGTWDSVKRGLTGKKENSTDELLVQKKDPLVLPPDYENLPSPDEREEAKEQISIFEKTLGTTSIEENSTSPSSSSVEQSILKEIRKK